MENKDSDIFQPAWIISSCWLTGQLLKKKLYLSMQWKTKVAFKAHYTPVFTCISTAIQYIKSTIVGRRWLQLLHFCPPHVLTFFVWFLPTSLQLSLSLIPNLTPKMQAVYLRRAEAIPLSSPTRCFIPKRDLFSKINGESKGLPKWYLPWHEVIATKSKLSK